MAYSDIIFSEIVKQKYRINNNILGHPILFELPLSLFLSISRCKIYSRAIIKNNILIKKVRRISSNE